MDIKQAILDAQTIGDIENGIFSLLAKEKVHLANTVGYSTREPSEEANIGKSTYEDAKADTSGVNRRFIARLGRLGASLIASKMAKRYERKNPAMCIGGQVLSAEDVAIIGQVFRHPGFETFRVLFVRGGRIIHQQGVTSRLPGSVQLGDEDEINIIYNTFNKIKEKCKAEGYYLLHNHPSGDVSVSEDDVKATEDFSKNIDGFIGHVVVNNNTYAVIDNNFNVTYGETDIEPVYDAHEPSIDHDLLGRLVVNTKDFIGIAKSLKNQDLYMHIVGLDSKNRVSGIADFPVKTAVETDEIKLLAILRDFSENTSSSRIILTNVPNEDDIFNVVIRAFLTGSVFDVVFNDMKTAMNMAKEENILPSEIGRQFSGVVRPARMITESLSDAAREAMGHEDATQAMKDSGNYRKGHCRIAGFDVTIEQPAGSYRQGIDPDGTPWKTRMNHHYGLLRKTVGADGDHVDAFFNPDIADEEFENMPIFVIDQVDKEGKFDESKCMFGFTNKQEAKAAYISNYSPGWEGLGDIHQFDVESFKSWVMDNAKTKKAVSSAVFEATGNWRERIMVADSLDGIEHELKTVFSLTSEDESDNITIQNVSPADSNVTDGQTVTTWATKSKIDKYQKDAERLSKKAEKFSITDYITIEKTGNVRNAYWVRFLVDVKRDGEHIYEEKLIPEGEKIKGEVVGMTKQYEVTVSGKPLKIEGWYVAGKAEHTMDDKGNYHALVRGYNIRKEDVKSCGPLCEHCGHKRRRNSTFILKNDQGEVKQVGSTCVDDFTGHEGADSIADLMGSSWKLFTIGDETEDGEYSGGDKISAYPVKAYIAHVVKVMEADKGYISSSEPGSTAYSALNSFFSDKVTDEHTQKAEEVLEWARSIENPDSAYMDNIKTLGSIEYFPKTLLGVAGSMVHAYNKSISRKIENDSGLNEYFGNPSEKIKDIKAKIVSIKPIDSYYGRSYLYIFKADTGHTLKWFSSKDAGGEPGNSIMLSGTIKAHDEYNGRKQTAITRGKITVLGQSEEEGKKQLDKFTESDTIESSDQLKQGDEMKIKDSIEVYKQQIEDRFKGIVTGTFENMVKALGPKLKGAFNHSSFAHFMRIGTPVRSSLQTDSEGVYSINTDNLDKLAMQYASDTIEKWAAKIQSKVGNLENAEVKHLDGFRFSITGVKNGKSVSITQDMIVNSSSKGTLFNQFPARIYVDGKNVPESRYQDVVESQGKLKQGDEMKKLIAKIKRASTEKKTKIWQDADLTREQGNEIVRQMVLSIPPGHYKLHDRTYGTNLVDTVWEIYGWMPSMLINEPMMLGLQVTHPKKIYATFTLGLDAIEIKK